jgi:hypothetical protein
MRFISPFLQCWCQNPRNENSIPISPPLNSLFTRLLGRPFFIVKEKGRGIG